MPYRVGQVVEYNVSIPEKVTRTKSSGDVDVTYETWVVKYDVRAKVNVPRDMCRQHGGWRYSLMCLFSLCTIPSIDYMCVHPRAWFEPLGCSSPFLNDLTDPFDYEERKRQRPNKSWTCPNVPQRVFELVMGLAFLGIPIVFGFLLWLRNTVFCINTPAPFPCFEFEFKYDATSEEPWTIEQSGEKELGRGVQPSEFAHSTTKPGDEFEIYIPPILDRCIFLKLPVPKITSNDGPEVPQVNPDTA